MSGARIAALVLLAAAARAEAKGCHEVSEVVGLQRCSRFGSFWDVSTGHPWVVGLGLQVAHFPVGGATFHGTIVEAQGDAHPFSVSGDLLADRWTGAAPTLRVAMFPARVFYVGVEGQLGGGLLPEVHILPAEAAPGKLGVVVPPNAALAMHSTTFSMQSLGAVAGLSVPVGRVDLGVEVLIGFRSLSANFDWDNPDAASRAAGGCWRGAKGGQICPWVDTDYAFSLRLEPRASLAVRLTPWTTLRAMVGVDALQRGAGVTASAMLEVHTRSYDGFFQRQPAGN